MDRKNLQDTAPRLPIGALSRRTGCNIETIRYYEKIGLLSAPARSDGGHRLYGYGHLMRLGFVRRARNWASRWTRSARCFGWPRTAIAHAPKRARSPWSI